MPTLFLVESASPSSEPDTASPPSAPHLVVVEGDPEDSSRAVTYQIIQTARELTEQAECAADEDLHSGAERTSTPLRNYTPSDIPASIESLKSRIENAGVEQARRVADCLRTTYEALLSSLAQPCLVLDSEGGIQNWNPAFARWLALSDAPTETRVTHFADRDSVRALFHSVAQLADEIAVSAHSLATPLTLPGPFIFHAPFGSVRAEQIILVPLCRIPGYLESAILLFPPVPL